MPVISIPLHVSGMLALNDSATLLVIPLMVTTLAMIWTKSEESIWAIRGLIAGIVAVACYDAIRIPLAMSGVWPDFIPALGGWVSGTESSNWPLGYIWRYVGDGGGMGMTYFVCCGVVMRVFPRLVTSRPILLSVSAGIFIWTGLILTVAILPLGESMLFELTPMSLGLSLIGHLVYGGVLGLFLRRFYAK